MVRPLVTILGKSVRGIARLRGGGTALPGLVVERIDPNFVSQSLNTIPMGVLLVSGTNGKTTTTKIIVELLERNGLKVFTNKTGSNFSRGVAAALLEEMSLTGKIKADIAVLELDEAHAVGFAKLIRPRYSLFLNVMRDQLDRFGEIDSTAKLLSKVASYTTELVVLNREDPLVANINSGNSTEVKYFGLSSNLKRLFPSDKELHDQQTIDSSKINADVTLDEVESGVASYSIDGHTYKLHSKLNGLYNLYNAAGALAIVRHILRDKTDEVLIKSLEKIGPAFGRGEAIKVENKNVTLVLVKNPSGFRLGIESFKAKDSDIMIVINDNFADSRDVSWLWDVDFTKLDVDQVRIVSGIRADDMALRLNYDDISIGSVEPSIKKAIKKFIKNGSDNKIIFCTYTAMLAVRKSLTDNKPLGESK